MSLIVYDLFGEKRDKVQRAIDLVRSFEPPDKYYLACGEFASSFGGVKFSPFGTNFASGKISLAAARIPSWWKPSSAWPGWAMISITT